MTKNTTTMLEDKIKCSYKEVPFRTSLSLEYLVESIEQISRQKSHPLNTSARALIKKLEGNPVFSEAIADYSVLKENKKLVDHVMAFAMNPLDTDTELQAAMEPFFPRPFFSTRLFDSTLRGDHLRFEMENSPENDMLLLVAVYQAYLIILHKFYGFDFDLSVPFTFKLINEDNGSVRYFKLVINSNYTAVKVDGKLPKLSQADFKSLFNNTSDLDYWDSKIPLKKFEFTGFLMFSYVDVTYEHVISQLKSDLLNKHTILSDEGFGRIQEKVGALMDLPELKFGLAAFSDFESTINQNVIWKSIIPQSELPCDEYLGTMYETAYNEKRIVLTDDVQQIEDNKAKTLFLKKGIRSHAVVPLILEEEIVGMMEFGAPKAGQLNFVRIKRFHELFPVFAIALKRSKEELNDRIQAIIQEECTAIHPTVAWRFWEAASRMVDSNLKGESSKMEPIVFADVVPFYGATDIRNSSIERNHAIRTDLEEHLKLAKSALVQGLVGRDMPLIDHLVYKIDGHLQTVSSSIKAGDEVSILEFIRHEVEPVLRQIESSPSINDEVSHYFSNMDPELGVLYRKRKDFEDSLTRINERVGAILDEEQLNAQAVFPHYFEKYRTDGVEYNGYIGQALVKEQTYDPVYLKNIRLWQLIVKARIAKEIRTLSPSLPVQLDVTQLILVHSNPLSIAFRQDEKKFDVAGAYNIRYEITKKRIDKARISGSNERVTQVGKIAIIYSHSEEIEEYKRYIDYMIAKGMLKEQVEDLELEDMKGASGLRALRVEVELGPTEFDPIGISEIEQVIQSS